MNTYNNFLENINLYREKLRVIELRTIKDYFKPGQNILEIGGDTGLQANVLSSMGCMVRSIDIKNERPNRSKYFPVETYDGYNIPFAENTFDIVFSSNVLEHIRELDKILFEIKRVLKPSGLAIHIIPSLYWLLWSYITFYPSQIIKLIMKINEGSHRDTNYQSDKFSCPKKKHIINYLLPPKHGSAGNLVTQLCYFRVSRWIKVFRNNGFFVKCVIENRLFYTGNHILKDSLPIRLRKKMALFLGSAANIFIMTSYK